MDRLEIKAEFAVDEAGTVEGIAWPFDGGPDMMNDLIAKGAFAGAMPPLPMLFSHDQRDTVGVWDSITETDRGLEVRGRLLVDDVARAREVRALVREKAVTGLTIGYRAKRAITRKGGGRTLQEIDLKEISIVAVGMHPGARITFAKAAAAEQLEEGVMPEEQTAAPEIAALEAKTAEIAETVKGLGKLGDRLDRIEAKVNRPAGTGTGTDEHAAAERKAFVAYLQKGMNAPADELKSLTVSSDPQGGYLAPAEMASEFIRDLVEFSPIRSVASIRGTAAPSVIYPTRTHVTNAKWKGETQEQEASEPGFGQAEVAVKELNTYVDISNQLLADSGGQADSEVRLALAEDFGQKEALAFVSGNGALEPEGFLTNAEIAYTPNGHATIFNADSLIDLIYALPATYRNRGTWAMNGTTLALIRKVQDAVGQYLWQPSLQAGQPETLLGRPIVEMVDLPDPVENATPIVYGDWSGYRIVDRVGFSVLVNPYIRATEGITRIHATRRVGGRVLQPAKFRKLRMVAS